MPRHPNVIWEQLAADALDASLIVDGHHLPAATVKAMVRAKGVERTILVTDAIAAAGCPPGRYRMGAVECELGADGRVSLPGTPFLAGSSLTMDRAIANTVRFTGLPIEAVIAMASVNPARYLGTTTAGTVTAEWDRGAVPRCDVLTVDLGPDRVRSLGLTPSQTETDTMNIAFLDWAVLVAYLIIITAIGLIVGYRVRHSGEYFLGGRKFGPWLMIGQSFGVGTHAEMPVALAGAVYSVGASAIWFQWKNLFITPFYWLMAPVFRRIRRTTMAEFTEDRYGSWMAAIYIVFALCYFIINTGSMLKGAGKVISQATGGGVGVNEIVVAMTVMFILYSFVGGLVAAAWTDLFQGILIIALSFMLIPLGWQAVGGLEGMKASLEPFRFSLATPSGIGPWVIAMLTVNGLVGIMAQPHQLAAVGTGRDEHTCRQGMLYGNMVKRVCTVGWALVGLIVAAMVAQGQVGGGARRSRERVRLRVPHSCCFPARSD